MRTPTTSAMTPSYIVSMRPHWFAPSVQKTVTLHSNRLIVDSLTFPLSSLKVAAGCLPNTLVLNSRRHVVTISAHPNHPRDWDVLHSALMHRPNGFIPVSVLGRGAFGTVYEAIAPGKAVYAVKRVDKALLRGRPQLDAARREIAVLKKLPAHRNVVTVYHAKETEKTFLIVMEKMNGTLLEMVRERKMDETEVLTVVREVLQGVAHLHRNGYVHRDVKLENVLVGDNGTFKLCDFGLAIKESQISGEVVGTGYARAPEIGEKGGYGKRVDAWAVGILLFVMMFRRLPFSSVEEMKGDVNDWARGWFGVSDGVRELLRGLLKRDPKERLDVEGALGMSVFDVVNGGLTRATFKRAVEKILRLLKIVGSLQRSAKVAGVV
eukprot:GFKZ01015206.1.p1 GENE.GFKZ01015206.1~~GFKZ01015206.1.p1  ORF type:complete len:389 (-),score=73.95 GFKZ01015206.1:1333-2469(-)